MVNDKDGRPKECLLVVECFCIYGDDALLGGPFYGKQVYMEREFLSVFF